MKMIKEWKRLKVLALTICLLVSGGMIVACPVVLLGRPILEYSLVWIVAVWGIMQIILYKGGKASEHS